MNRKPKKLVPRSTTGTSTRGGTSGAGSTQGTQERNAGRRGPPTWRDGAGRRETRGPILQKTRKTCKARGENGRPAGENGGQVLKPAGELGA